MIKPFALCRGQSWTVALIAYTACDWLNNLQSQITMLPRTKSHKSCSPNAHTITHFHLITLDTIMKHYCHTSQSRNSMHKTENSHRFAAFWNFPFITTKFLPEPTTTFPKSSFFSWAVDATFTGLTPHFAPCASCSHFHWRPVHLPSHANVNGSDTQLTWAGNYCWWIKKINLHLFHLFCEATGKYQRWSGFLFKTQQLLC